MKTIYEISYINAYFTGATKTIGLNDGHPIGWTDIQPIIPEGLFARWDNDAWVITDTPPPQPVFDYPTEPLVGIPIVEQVAPKVVA